MQIHLSCFFPPWFQASPFTPVFMEAKSLNKMFIFGQDLVCTLFMGKYLRKDLAQDLISAKMLPSRASVRQTFERKCFRQNDAHMRRDCFIKNPLINNGHSALNTPRIEIVSGFGQPDSLYVHVSAAGLWPEPVRRAKNNIWVGCLELSLIHI